MLSFCEHFFLIYYIQPQFSHLIMCDQVTKDWAKAIQREWNLLQKSLPSQFMLIAFLSTFCFLFSPNCHKLQLQRIQRRHQGAYIIITFRILMKLLFHSNLVMLAYYTCSELSILYFILGNIKKCKKSGFLKSCALMPLLTHVMSARLTLKQIIRILNRRIYT